jgi:phosphoribosylaminoimidazole-succinocarboxamide synthase
VPLDIPGATHLHSGKVRDLYEREDGNLLMVASDRISAYDFALEPGIPDKGEILTRLSLWWFEQLKDLVPNQSLALSVERHPQAFPAVELTVEEAIGYLRREPLPGMSDQPRGYVVVSCMGLALGFLKNLGNRTNNLYPQEWRIKSSHITAPCQIIHRNK